MKNLIRNIKQIVSKYGDQITIKNAYYFCQGYIRYWIYYSKHFRWLMRSHIKEQIDFRIKIMSQSCYNNGSCELCGCHTTALQMANKSCEKPCYPPMLNRSNWKTFKTMQFVVVKGNEYLLEIKEMNCKNPNTPKYRHTLYVNGVRKHIRNLHTSLI